MEVIKHITRFDPILQNIHYVVQIVVKHYYYYFNKLFSATTFDSSDVSDSIPDFEAEESVDGSDNPVHPRFRHVTNPASLLGSEVILLEWKFSAICS